MTRVVSVTCCVLLIVLAPAVAAQYSWQEPHAKVLPTGDLEWAPKPFVFQKGESIRYVDYEGGSDANDGLTKNAPWKHHPWDSAAEGNAEACSGIHTYVFKQGVIYRGRLVGKESGEAGNPIRLTRDPSWGIGEAMLFGSQRLRGVWKKCTADDVPKYMPEPEKVWYLELGADAKRPFGLWMLDGSNVIRLEIARHPNWTVSNPDDPQFEWAPWTDFEGGRGKPHWLTNEEIFKGRPKDFFQGATVWSEWAGNMGSDNSGSLAEVDPATGRVRLANCGGVRKGCRFFLEDLPGYLDGPGEYYFSADGEHAGRLYARLPGDRDPNTAVLEAAELTWLINVVDQAHIHISGLRFSFDNADGYDDSYPSYAAKPTAVRIAGHCQDIAITNCRFLHVMGVVAAFTRMDKEMTGYYMQDLAQNYHANDLIDELVIADNDIAFSARAETIVVADGHGIFKSQPIPVGKVRRASILRNRVYWAGFRPGSDENSNIAAIQVLRPALGEIAGNVVDMSWGSGIFVMSGKKDKAWDSVPLTRMLIHHNKCINTMLACNDYGGIAYWQGGPIYTYCNISANAIGHKPGTDLENDWKTVAYNYYLDGTFKSYTFNNIAWGKYNEVTNPYRSRGPFFVVLGYMNHLFNNSFYKFRHGILGSSGNRSTFLANVVANVSGQFIQQNREGDTSLRGGGDTGNKGAAGMPTNGYGYNVFCGKNPIGNARMVRSDTLEGWQKGLEEIGARLSQTGWRIDAEPFVDADRHNFTPGPDAPVKDRGVKVFVPWGLYGTVGEWNFCLNPANPELVLGEHLYMDESYLHRHMYDHTPRHNLNVKGVVAADYIDGELEDWTRGALVFDGQRVAVLPDTDLKCDFEYSGRMEGGGRTMPGNEPGTWSGAKRHTPDMGTNSFLIEAYLRTEPGHSSSGLVWKRDDTAGYTLYLNSTGCPMVRVSSGEDTGSVASSAPVNDGNWHHLIVEVNRPERSGTLYLDGKVAGRAAIDLPPDASLSNAGDFLVGCNLHGEYFRGAIDFLRVCQGTLADSYTTIEELYAWEFDGPFLADWAGRKPEDGKRDAGAIDIAGDAR